MTIQTDRGRLAAVKQLVDWQEAAGYSLPQQVQAAFAAYDAARCLRVPEPPAVRHVETAAELAATALLRGETVDPATLAAEVVANRQQADVVEVARQLVSLTADAAGAHAAAVATDVSRAFVVKSLRPAYDDVLAQAREHAPALGGHDLDAGGWQAPAKVRAARAAMVGLADRHRLLREARRLTVGLSGAEPQHDQAGEFALLRRPQALVGNPPPVGRLPRPDIPTDPIAALLWLVGTAEPAGPWLPTVAEQDEAWHAVYGERAARLRQGAVMAQAVGARGVAPGAGRPAGQAKLNDSIRAGARDRGDGGRVFAPTNGQGDDAA